MKSFNLNYIKVRRVVLELTLHDVAISMGFKNASTYMKYENGDYSFKAEQLPLLAELFKCEIIDFFDWKVAEIEILRLIKYLYFMFQ
ncbi:helix-turn-helix transcriptional regulator [Metabacillus fastidiosus]|uniref:helix-turn-helix transcriptional regulator n=1 Tax=Metabacillus fastidiosus TaxID=1458 RepID=UPI002E207B87|nr:helix-turn-helix transcriptional regulator [Metabacillus fastidiosus]